MLGIREIRFNKPSDGNFWLTNFEIGYPITTSLPTRITKEGKIASDSQLINISGLTTFTFATSEHLFQALKFTIENNPNLNHINRIINALTPDRAREIGQERKFKNLELANKLIATGEDKLIEDTTSRRKKDEY
ncbi:12449_t:CDS:2 [Funneliformis geosporum]|uniref:12449_t:CDS:1 n=1 Tax=Funneliformis geosporum TaxID=1117311 RepID=A0A9W4SCH0_9GLOM|nr:12449_t:CDS:2 [Funneliformis geosporum]